VRRVQQAGVANYGWTLATDVVPVGIVSVAYGDGTWAGIDATSGISATTSPLTAWPATSGQTGWRIRYGGGDWVAVISNTQVATATDPTGTWTANTVTSGAFIIRGLDYVGSTWVVLSSDAIEDNYRIVTASDPTGTWTDNGQAAGDLFRSTFHRPCMATDGTTWVVVDQDDVFTASSLLGTWTWHGVIDGTEVNDNVSLVHDGTRFVAMANYSARVSHTTTPGIVPWTNLTVPTVGGVGDIEDMAYGGGLWLAVNDDPGDILHATDPTTST
jgi:hypothetical protein